MSLRRAIAMLFAVVLVAAACGDDDSSEGLSSGDGFSIEAALAEIPLDEEPGAIVSVGDLRRASELADLEWPDGDDDDAVRDWTQAIAAGPSVDQHTVFVPLAELLLATSGPPTEIAEELGWNLADVETFAEVLRPPFRALVVSGEDLGADVFEDGDLAELDDDIVTAGEGDDFFVDVEGRTAARPLGAPLRMGASGNRIIASSTTDVVRDWLDGELTSVADSEPHRRVAAALDGADAYAAMLVAGSTDGPGGPRLEPELDLGDMPMLTAGFEVVGVGWSVVDGEPVITIVHDFGDEDVAEEQVANIEAILRDGRILTNGQPVADMLEVDEVVADGTVTVTTVRPAEDGRLRAPVDMIMTRELLFAAG